MKSTRGRKKYQGEDQDEVNKESGRKSRNSRIRPAGTVNRQYQNENEDISQGEYDDDSYDDDYYDDDQESNSQNQPQQQFKGNLFNNKNSKSNLLFQNKNSSQSKLQQAVNSQPVGRFHDRNQSNSGGNNQIQRQQPQNAIGQDSDDDDDYNEQNRSVEDDEIIDEEGDENSNDDNEEFEDQFQGDYGERPRQLLKRSKPDRNRDEANNRLNREENREKNEGDQDDDDQVDDDEEENDDNDDDENEDEEGGDRRKNGDGNQPNSEERKNIEFEVGADGLNSKNMDQSQNNTNNNNNNANNNNNSGNILGKSKENSGDKQKNEFWKYRHKPMKEPKPVKEVQHIEVLPDQEWITTSIKKAQFYNERLHSNKPRIKDLIRRYEKQKSNELKIVLETQNASYPSNLPIVMFDNSGGKYYVDNSMHTVLQGTVENFIHINVQNENTNILSEFQANNGIYNNPFQSRRRRRRRRHRDDNDDI